MDTNDKSAIPNQEPRVQPNNTLPNNTVPLASTPAQPVASTPPPPVSSQHKSNYSTAFVIIFLICAFLSGLILAMVFFQNELQKLNAAKPSASSTSSISKTVIVGTDATAPPMESVNKQGGLIGYDIDLGYRLANEMGVKAEFKNIPWDNIFQALLDKKIDMIISSVTITDERKQKYAFSDSYINAGQVIVSRKDHPYKTTAELMGKKLSVQKGTTDEKEALTLTNPNLVVSFSDFVDATKALANGQVDAMISDLTFAKGFISEYDNLKITSDPFTNEYYGVVMRKENKDLLKKVNDALNILQVNGVLTDLKQKWLN